MGKGAERLFFLNRVPGSSAQNILLPRTTNPEPLVILRGSDQGRAAIAGESRRKDTNYALRARAEGTSADPLQEDYTSAAMGVPRRLEGGGGVLARVGGPCCYRGPRSG